MLAQVSPSVVIDWEGSIEAFLAPVLCKGAPAIERVLAEDQFAAPPLEEYRPMVESRQDPTDESPGSSPQSSNSAGASPYSRSKTGFRATLLAEFAQPNPVAAVFTEYHRCLRRRSLAGIQSVFDKYLGEQERERERAKERERGESERMYGCLQNVFATRK